MTAAFALLRRRLPRRAAGSAGFVVCWAGWCAAFPPRRLVARRVAAVMIGTVAVDAVGEELLWRGTFLDQFPGDVVRGALWPLAGFTVWHLAPQLVYPSPRGRAGFLLGAAVVGGASTPVAGRTPGPPAGLLPPLPAYPRGGPPPAGAGGPGGFRRVLVPHGLLAAGGVRPARFWLGTWRHPRAAKTVRHIGALPA